MQCLMVCVYTDVSILETTWGTVSNRPLFIYTENENFKAPKPGMHQKPTDSVTHFCVLCLGLHLVVSFKPNEGLCLALCMFSPPHRAGGHFSPHLDGPWVPHEDESSVFTVVIYLNSDFQGGGTRFLDEVSQSEYTWNYMCV